MASNESAETFEELNSTTTTAIATVTEEMPIENREELSGLTKATEAETETEMEAVEASSTTTSSSRRASASHAARPAAYRGVRFATNETEGDEDEDSWWWEVENENLTLDQVPNVTSVFTPSPEDILEQPTRVEETQNAVLEEEFESLHRIANRIKNTMNEQRERHFSESSDKSLSEHTEKPKRERFLSESSDKGLSEQTNPKPEEDSAIVDSASSLVKEQTLEEFKEELRLKRLTRQSAVQGMRDEIASLRKQLEREREISKRLRNGEKVEETPWDPTEIKPYSSAQTTRDIEGATALCKNNDVADNDDDDENPLSRSRHANIELANAQLALQMANSENLSLRGELDILQKQVSSLKDVIACCKQMLTVKEEQCNEVSEPIRQHEHRQYRHQHIRSQTQYTHHP